MRLARRVPVSALLGLLVGLLATIPLGVPAGVAFVSGGKASRDQPTFSYDFLPASTTPTANFSAATLGASPRPRASPAAVRLVSGSGVAAKAGEAALSQAGKRRLAKRLGEIPRSSSPVGQGGAARTGRWWEYDDVNGQRKIVVEHPDGTVHVGTPKPQSTHATGGPPKYYDDGNFGHVGE